MPAPSILKWHFYTKWFGDLRFTTRRWEPSFLGTVNMWLRNWPATGVTSEMACFLINSTLSMINGQFIPLQQGGLGMKSWYGKPNSSSWYPSKVHGSDVILFQFDQQWDRWPVGESQNFKGAAGWVNWENLPFVEGVEWLCGFCGWPVCIWCSEVLCMSCMAVGIEVSCHCTGAPLARKLWRSDLSFSYQAFLLGGSILLT